MRGRAWLMGWMAAVLLAGMARAQDLAPTGGQQLTAEGIVVRVMQHDAVRRAALAQYASERTYRMDYHGPIGERHAQMRVRMEFSAPDRKRFTVVSESGSTIFCHQVLRKLMEGEQEGALEANRLRSMLSPANYRLKLVGERVLDGVPAWVLEVTPIEENRFNYKGRVWVSKDDYAVMRIEGSPARSPSWLMGSSSFDYRYARTGEFWLPERNDTVSHLRVGGEITLAVDYGQYRIVASGALPASDPRTARVADTAKAKGVTGLAVSLP